MDNSASLNHSRWECKYHVVFIPKNRKKVLYGDIRRHLGEVFRSLAGQKECRVEEGHLMPDHVHMLLSVPPKYSIAHTIGFLKGKSAVRIHRNVLKMKGTLFGRSFWARGYCVSTVGWDEKGIREYIRHQEKLQQESEQAELEFE